MGSWRTQHWDSDATSGLRRRDRRSGPFRTYVPDPLLGTALHLAPELERRLSDAERAVRGVVGNDDDLAGIARFLLRSEAIASSKIEGIAPSVKQVAVAELSADERMPHVQDAAQLVANNLTTVEAARDELAKCDEVTLGHLIRVHAALLRDQPERHGIRKVQNWIGGSDHHPLDAEFVPPSPDAVLPAMQDLLDYLHTAAHAPLVQAALVHAQFETIHPFVDGNGRVGRALIHTVLTRRGLTPRAILPVSLVLSTMRSQYVEGLTRYRHDAPAGSPAAHEARAAWISVFTDAALLAAAQASRLGQALAECRDEWNEALEATRRAQGKSRGLRRDSVVARILADLPSVPLLTAATVQRLHGVSSTAANEALETLTEAGVLRRTKRSNVVLHQCDDVLDLVTAAERSLASTAFDTRISPPSRPVPARVDG